MKFNICLGLVLILSTTIFSAFGMEQNIKKDSNSITKFGKSSLKDLVCAYILQSNSVKVNLAKALELIPDLKENFDLISAIQNEYTEQEKDIIIDCMIENFKAPDDKKLLNRVYFKAIAKGHLPIVAYLDKFIDQEIFTTELDHDLVINS